MSLLILLLIIIGLVFNQVRLNKKTARKLMAQQDEIGKLNNSVQELLGEKEWLLKEVHHRVKNNLQTVVSLLESQSAYLKNNEALSAIQDSQSRIHAMSMIHQKLYQTENLTSIDMEKYTHGLINYLSDSFNIRNRIRFDLRIQPIELDVSQAIPIALIMNEAVTNAIKYAFPQRLPSNEVSVVMSQKNDLVSLTIADNGTGLPEGFDINSDECGLGLKLMQGLTEDIEGKFGIKSGAGLVIDITFIASILLHKNI